jgi:hypothetical protein
VSDGDIKTEAEATAEDAETTPADAPVEIPPCYKEMPFTPVDEQVPVVEKEPEKEASTEKETVAEESVKQEKIDDENAENQPKESDKIWGGQRQTKMNTIILSLFSSSLFFCWRFVAFCRFFVAFFVAFLSVFLDEKKGILC